MTGPGQQPRPAVTKFAAQTALAVPAPQIFPLEGRVVTVTNWTEKDSAGERHRGLVVEVALDAADSDEAMRLGLGPASMMVSLMSFASGAASGSLRPLIVYVERTDGGCDVAQFAEWPIDPSARRMLTKERMDPVVTLMNGLPIEDRARVLRAVDWYRKALAETNVFDRFAALWIGLESINPVLIKRRSLPTTQTIRRCPKCGEPVVTMDTIAGISDLLERHFGADERKTVRRFRQEFMHSTQPLDEILGDADSSAKTAREALRTGLLELLDASKEEATVLSSTPMRLPERNRVRYDYRMQPLRIVTIPPGQATPRIEVRRFTGERTQEPDGRTRERIVHELELHDFAGEVPPPFEMRIAIPSADPDDARRRFEMTSFEIVSKDTGEAVPATISPILGVADSEGRSQAEAGSTEDKPSG